MNDTIVVAIISAMALIIINIIIGQIQLRRIPPQNQVDDATAASAYASLNKELRENIEKLETRLQGLENMRIGPYRITTDIVISPEPRIMRNEIVLMTSEPVVSRPPAGKEEDK